MYDLIECLTRLPCPDTYQIIIMHPKHFDDQPDRLVLFGSQTFDSTNVLFYYKIECQIKKLLKILS